jgi:hypothetical protein
MKLKIPSDWNGHDWQCLQIQWPDSPEWTALLMGLLTLLTRGAIWRETGDKTEIPTVQEIAWQIYDANYPFRDCAGELVTLVTTTGNCGGGLVVLEDDNMGQVVTEVSFDETTGILRVEYGPCCVREWQICAAGGQPPAFEDIEPDIPPGQTEDSTSCAMAIALVAVVSDLVDVGLEYAGLSNPFTYYDKLSEVNPAIDLAYSDVLRMWIAAHELSGIGLGGEAQNVAIDEYLRCQWATQIPMGNEGISKATYDTLKSSIHAQIGVVIHPSAYLGMGGVIADLWQWALYSIGPSDAQKITYYAQPQPSDDCDCADVEDPEIPYTGSVHWTGAVLASDNIGYISNVYASNNGKTLHVTWYADQGNYIDDATLKFGISMDAPINSLKIEARPVGTSEMPTQEWVNSGCEAVAPVDWTMPQFGSAWTETPSTVGSVQHTLVVANTQPDSDTDVSYAVRKCPDNTSPNPFKVYVWELEIIEVNGVAV